jgi:Spy/CpxP family protein refolding chaperone
MSRLTQRTLAFYLLAIFLAGAAAGSAIGYASGRRKASRPPRPQELARHIQSRLETRLHLTSEQRARIQPVVEQSCAEIGSVHRDCGRRISEAFHKMNLRLAEYLTAEQRQELDRMEEERGELFQSRCSTRNGAEAPDRAPTGHQQ